MLVVGVICVMDMSKLPVLKDSKRWPWLSAIFLFELIVAPNHPWLFGLVA
jgi:hypothetical protein